MKSISTINPTITENTDCSIVNMHTPVIDVAVCVLLYHYASFLLQLFECLANIPSKE